MPQKEEARHDAHQGIGLGAYRCMNIGIVGPWLRVNCTWPGWVFHGITRRHRQPGNPLAFEQSGFISSKQDIRRRLHKGMSLTEAESIHRPARVTADTPFPSQLILTAPSRLFHWSISACVRFLAMLADPFGDLFVGRSRRDE